MLIEKTEFSNDFSYSFPIDKSYCNIVQLGLDKMEFRIDNKSFMTLFEESNIYIILGKLSRNTYEPAVVENREKPRNRGAQ